MDESSTLQDGTIEQAEQLFLRFAESVFVKIKRRMEMMGQEPFLHARVSFVEDGWRTVIDEMPFDYFAAMAGSADAILSEEFETCAKFHLEHGLFHLPALTDVDGNPISNPTYEQQAIWLQPIALPAIDVAVRQRTLTPTPEQILERYRSFAEGWRAGTQRWDVVIPLLNFKADVHGVRFGDHVALVPFTPEQKDAFWSVGMFPQQSMSVWNFAMTRSALTGFHIYRQNVAPSDHEIVDEATSLITAMRLLKSGDVGAPVWYGYDNPSSPWNEAVVRTLDDYRVRSLGQYELHEAELASLRLLFDQIRSMTQRSPRGGLQVALRRFNQSYSRDSSEDRIIDLTISLESSLLAGINDELKYRLSLRGVALLAGFKPAVAVQPLLQAMYDARSAIVHSGASLEEALTNRDIRRALTRLTPALGSEPNAFLLRCEDLVRDVLQAFIARLAEGRSLDQVNMDLDDRIVNGLASGPSA